MMKNAEGHTVRDHIDHPTKLAISRWLAKIQVSEIRFFENEPCWEWQGCKSKTTGYGQFSADGRRAFRRRIGPHVFAHEYFIGPIPDGYEVNHICFNRACCNPAHLNLKTRAENVLDPKSRTPSAINLKKTHCNAGHLLGGENLLVNANGSRRCKACRDQRIAEFRMRNPDANKAACLRYKAKRQAMHS